MNEIEGKVIPMLYGGIVADALGVPVEFKKRDSYFITDMTGYGTYNQPPGTWSDDTSLTMCLVENYLDSGTMEDLMKKFERYYQEGYWTPFGQMFDIGIATREAILNYQKGIAIRDCGGKGEYDNGNGALMRIAPIVPILVNITNSDERKRRVIEVCELTHGHIRSHISCIYYVEYMVALYKGADKFVAYQQTNQLIKDMFQDEKELIHFKRILGEEIEKISREEIGSNGYVVTSLEASLWSFLTSDSYQEAVLTAVNLGDDTDTIGFITGTIAGLYYGLEAIPQNWLKQLVDFSRIEEKVQQFCKWLNKKAI